MFESNGLTLEQAQEKANAMDPVNANDKWWEGYQDRKVSKSMLQTGDALSVCSYHAGWMYAAEAVKRMGRDYAVAEGFAT